MLNKELKPKAVQFHGTSPEDHIYHSPGAISWRISLRQNVWTPPTDVFETEDRFMVRVEIAGMKEADFSVRFEQNVLTISGIRSDSQEPRAFHRMEIPFGEFVTEVELSSPVDPERIEAEYLEGFLHVILPKPEPKQIIIK